MNFYQTQIAEIKAKYLPEDYIFQRVIKAKSYIQLNFAAPLTLEEIAGEGNFSKYHFIRMFKIAYGITPHQYLISVRIEKAKQLLKSQKSVTETCFAVGFESVSSFTGLFKKMTGAAPSAYRNKYRR